MPSITPRLIHPQSVVIEQLDQAGTTWDDVFREPVTDDWPAVGSGSPPEPTPSAPAYSTSVTLKAQISYTRAREVESTKDGDAPRGEGYLLFSAAALTTAEITLKVGDRCTKIGALDVEYYFVDIIPMGHYDKPYFMKAVFIRRKAGPSDARGGGLR
jgi:hypothetical protein